MKRNLLLASQLPDLPRWVEVRANLLWEECEIFGWEQEPALAFVLREVDTKTVFVIGQPAESAIREALHEETREVIAPIEQGNWLSSRLPEWTPLRAVLYRLPDLQHLPTPAPGQVASLSLEQLAALSLPTDLLAELQSGARHSPIAATFVAGQPVSFCYAGAITESLWDISIDTLPEHRRKGHAALCVAQLIRHFHRQGKQPVWGALVDNPASWQLARKLGFVPVDELVLFEPSKPSTLSTAS